MFSIRIIVLAVLSALCHWSPSVAEVEPSTVALPTNSGEIGPDYGRREIQFSAFVSGHLGSLLNESGAQSSSGVIGQFSIMQPLRRHEAMVDFAFARFGTVVPADAAVGQDVAVEQSTLRVGNAALTYYFPWRTLNQQIRLGLGLTAPLAHLRSERIERTRADALAYEGASAMAGHRNLWLWMPRTFTGVGHFDYLHRSPTGLLLGFGTDVAGAIRVSDEEKHGLVGMTTTPSTLDLVFQAVLEMALDRENVRLGVSASYVTLPLKQVDEQSADQIAVELNSRFRLGNADMITRFTIPLDPPAGFAFESEKYWAFTIGVATATERQIPAQ